LTPDLIPPPTARIRFRPYQAEDAAAVTVMFADGHARRFYPTMVQPDAAARWIAWNLDSYQTTGFGLWVIEHRDTGEFLGDCGLTLQPVDDGHLVEVGYHLTVAHRGRGYATEAARACIEHALHHLGLPLVCSIVDPDNTPSKAVASRIHRSHRTALSNSRPTLLYWTDNPATPPPSPPWPDASARPALT
jgi:RimJ/RimL family protein N-acetyltransferase